MLPEKFGEVADMGGQGREGGEGGEGRGGEGAYNGHSEDTHVMKAGQKKIILLAHSYNTASVKAYCVRGAARGQAAHPPTDVPSKLRLTRPC